MGDRSPCVPPAKPIVTMRRRHPRRSNAARRSDASSCWDWWAGAGWARSTPRTIPSWTAASRSSCCATAPAAAATATRARACCARRRPSRRCRTRTSSSSTTWAPFDDRIFIAMEFVDGHTLGYWMQAKQRTLAEILDVFGAAARGLAAAHEKELVHRDFKPDNVMVASDGQVRVMDFGLVRFAIDREKPGERTPSARGSRRASSRSTRTRPTSSTPPPRRPGRSARSAVSDALGLNLTRDGDDDRDAGVHVPGAVPGRRRRRAHVISSASASRSTRHSTASVRSRGPSITELAANVTGGQGAPGAGRGPRCRRRSASALLRGLSVDPAARFPSMEALLAALRHEPALSGARRFTASAVAKLEGSGSRPPPTTSNRVRAPPRARSGAAFLATGKPYASAAFEAASRVLDRFARRWSTSTSTPARRRTCAASSRRRSSTCGWRRCRRRSTTCARCARSSARRRLTPSRTPSMPRTRSGTLERCNDVKLLRAIVRPHDDPPRATTVKQLQARLTEVRALQRVGRVAEGLKRIVPLEAGGARHRLHAPADGGALHVRADPVRRRRHRFGGAHARGRRVGGRALPPRRGDGRSGDDARLSSPVTRSRVSRRARSGTGTPRRCCGGWADTIASGAGCSTTGARCAPRKDAFKRRSRISSARSPPRRRRSARTIPTSPSRSATPPIYLDELGDTARAADYGARGARSWRRRWASITRSPRSSSPIRPNSSTISAATKRRRRRRGERSRCSSARPIRKASTSPTR